MKIYDCFIYFDEDLLLNVRLNILNKFVDKFIIVESKYSHKGDERKPNFDIRKFEKHKHKIEYILLNENPKNLFSIEKNVDFLTHLTISGLSSSFWSRK